MPYYYYQCSSCGKEKRELRSISKRLETSSCEYCESGTMNWVSFPQTEEMRQVFDEAPSGIILGGQETIFNNPKRKEFQKTLQRIHNTMPGSILNKTTEGVK